MDGLTHSRSRSTSAASLTRQTTRSLRQGRKGSVILTTASLAWRRWRNGEGSVILTIAPGVPFSPGAPASP